MADSNENPLPLNPYAPTELSEEAVDFERAGRSVVSVTEVYWATVRAVALAGGTFGLVLVGLMVGVSLVSLASSRGGSGPVGMTMLFLVLGPVIGFIWAGLFALFVVGLLIAVFRYRAQGYGWTPESVRWLGVCSGLVTGWVSAFAMGAFSITGAMFGLVPALFGLVATPLWMRSFLGRVRSRIAKSV
ncbi:hypothetical protein FYK55_18965 [Roseiconus nitratireducens]|uniref:Uncharacterized protein n=1 Tax=Roseiconus nitratireducens TaxID=2605748 RepID=A0A5M6D0M1_9BACT|nr:hypothetical protein [Roseiconus nitratireducens]KAA5540984.1 hypothetical protein FYK55_18965 [Roseiconus nitratireducens]